MYEKYDAKLGGMQPSVMFEMMNRYKDQISVDPTKERSVNNEEQDDWIDVNV